MLLKTTPQWNHSSITVTLFALKASSPMTTGTIAVYIRIIIIIIMTIIIIVVQI